MSIFIIVSFVFLVSYAQETVIPAKIIEENGSYKLYRGGEPYYVNGAVGGQDLELLTSIGGNSIRMGCGRNAKANLDRAHELGLSVLLNVRFGAEWRGFDYDDKEAVAEQLEIIRQDVLKYKDHPALLMWGIGNELTVWYTNPKMWDALNDVSKMIHELDPNHPTTTHLPYTEIIPGHSDSFKKRDIDLIKERCADLDLLCFNVYFKPYIVPDPVRKFGWDKAYLVTEWGPSGDWMAPQTEWGVPIEETSTEKAKSIIHRYKEIIEKDTKQCLGSYVFYWGQRQETTHTWYNLFLESGEPTEIVDAMQYLWTDKWPKERAPHIDSLHVNGKSAYDNVYLNPNKSCVAQVFSDNVNFNKIKVAWEIYHESTDIKAGGAREEKPPLVEEFKYRNNPILQFNAPEKEGAYRIFVTLKDEKLNRVATGNVPFFVKQ